MDLATLHAAIMAALAKTLRPVPEVAARLRAAGLDVDDKTLCLELRVLHGQLRVEHHGGGWRLLGADTALSMLASRAAGLRALTVGA